MKKSLFLLLALPGLVQAETANGFTFASSETGAGTVNVTVDSGATGNSWAAAFGNNAADQQGQDNQGLVHTGDITLRLAGDYTGSGNQS